MTTVTALTPALVEGFRHDGFAVVPDLLSTDELTRFGAAVDAGVRPLTFHPTIANGAMGYLPGSHRLGLREFVDIFTGTGQDPLPRRELREVDPVWVEVPAGSVAFHHGLTFHLAKPNTTGTVRRVHTVIYFADGSTRGEGRFSHPSVERAAIAIGVAIASDVTPIAWPRAPGDPPGTPAEPIG